MYSSHCGSRCIKHLGSAHDDAQVEVLKAGAWQRLAAGQGELDLGLGAAAASYRTLKRRLPEYVKASWRAGLSAAYARRTAEFWPNGPRLPARRNLLAWAEKSASYFRLQLEYGD